MNRKEFEKKILELTQRIREQTTAFTDDSAASQRKRVDKAMDDLFYFAKTYFPHYIDSPFGAFHKEIHLQTSISRQITAIAAPRAHGKSVLLAVIKPIWEALRESKKFIIFVSENQELARERAIAVRVELLHNRRIIHDWGEQLRPGQGEDTDFRIRIGTRFLAQGYKQAIRGKLNGSYRPDYIVLDDFEDHKSTNPRIARNKLKYVREEAYGALPKRGGVIIWLGNLTHQESALAYFRKAIDDEKPDSCKFLLYRAINAGGKPLWPERYTIAELEQIRQTMGTPGFERHYQMNPMVEGVKFKSNWFQYAAPSPDKPQRIVCYCDPAFGTSDSSDYRAIITLAMADKRYYILDAWLRRESIYAMLRYMYLQDQRYKLTLGMEKTLWQKLLWEFIPPMAKEFGYILPVAGIENTIKKDERIERLTPYYEWGWIFHPTTKSTDLSTLEEQILGYPDHPKKDGPDALAGAVEMVKTLSNPFSYRVAGKRQSADFRKMP